ncbi:uncharacterized protein METZ01_LOCUS31668, partial [marine metagenome]
MTEQKKIRIEPAKPGDAGLVLQFIKGLADYERLSDDVVATEDNIHESLFGSNANAEAYFAFYENEAVACAVFCQHYSTYSGRSSLYLEDIFVLSEWRAHGVGRELMAYGAGLAQARGYTRMEWSVLDWNEQAITFYENLGAERLEGWYIYRLSGDALKRL